MADPKRAEVMPDPNVFGAAYLAGCMAFGISSAALDHVKTAWQIQRQFLRWVADGEDAVAFDKAMALEKAASEKAARQVVLDREAAEAKAKAAREQFAAKA